MRHPLTRAHPLQQALLDQPEAVELSAQSRLTVPAYAGGSV